jgi:hypothetical protein
MDEFAGDGLSTIEESASKVNERTEAAFSHTANEGSCI